MLALGHISLCSVCVYITSSFSSEFHTANKRRFLKECYFKNIILLGKFDIIYLKPSTLVVSLGICYPLSALPKWLLKHETWILGFAECSIHTNIIFFTMVTYKETENRNGCNAKKKKIVSDNNSVYEYIDDMCIQYCT